ncbi:MAG: VPLPA-CTERM-specific exosortase XrtD, partial [Candidatus Heimdallarchaeota archaeon]|nr:VPLPA-CTERM-specific exosortase XrtD [Candidatus Heimdallarchaeota archaeon]
YAFVISLIGITYSLIGREGMREIWPAFLLLFFTIPLPAVIFQQLSQSLQLISSQIGVYIIRLFDISVYLEGNVIDLGAYKLQVVEACSGLRYLFPLMTLGFIAAYIYKASLWKKIIIFLSTIPITVVLNSIRIGIIGVLVEYWGQSMAEGFLHDFEGWVVFMACTFIVVFEMWLLSKFGSNRIQFSDAFNMDLPEEKPKDYTEHVRPIPQSFVASLFIVIIVFIASFAISEREVVKVERKTFYDFPLKIDGWTGKKDNIESMYIDILKLDDYFIGNYSDDNQNYINLYIAYYSDQRKGASIHSPSACIPGGGWAINSNTEKLITDVNSSINEFKVNRLIIKLHDQTQLVYYWFKLQDNYITDEYLLKGHLFLGALTKNRSDGALIRLTTMLRPHENIESADDRLTEMTKKVSSHLGEYVPD